MTLSKIYRLPAPEFTDKAKGPEDFEKLARAVEDQAFPSLQDWGTRTADINKWAAWQGPTRVTTVYSTTIASNGIVGWVDVDANVWAALGKTPIGTAGFLVIKVNGADVRRIRWHNWYRTEMNCVYNSVRWPNLGGLPVTVDVIWEMDANPPNKDIYLLSYDFSYQVYGKKVK